jgi:glycosyltransferase involved in cell wall biosynthesis
MAAGVPAVAYAVGGVADVAGSPPALALVPEGQCAELVERTLELVADKAARQILIERGLRRVGDFSIGSAVALNLDLYASIFSDAPHGSHRLATRLALQEDGGSPDAT